jgi:hypothetical protein
MIILLVSNPVFSALNAVVALSKNLVSAGAPPVMYGRGGVTIAGNGANGIEGCWIGAF